MKNNLKLLMSAALCCAGVCSPAFAATNPTNPTETSSTGSSDLSVTIPVLYKISGIADLTTASYVGNGALSMNDDVCIYTNNLADTNYRITLQGSTTCSGGSCPGTPSDVFAIANDTNNQAVEYTAYWNDVATTTGRTAVGVKGGANATTANQGPSSQSVTCGGSPNANFSVDFTEADLLAVGAGAYTGTLTITLIAPT